MINFFSKKKFVLKNKNEDKVVENKTEEIILYDKQDIIIEENIAEEFSMIPEFKEEGDVVQEFYLYRDIGSHKFSVCSEEKPQFFVSCEMSHENPRMPEKDYFAVKSYGQDFIQLNDGTVLKGNVAEIPCIVDDFLPVYSDLDNQDGYDDSYSLQGYIPLKYRVLSEPYTEIKALHRKYEKRQIEKAKELFRVDECGVPRNYYGAKLKLNWTKMIFDFELSFAIDVHTFFHSGFYNEKQSIRFSFSTGRYYVLSKFNYSQLQEIDKDDNYVPPEIFSFVKEKVLAMRNAWANRNLSANIAYGGFDFFKAVVKYPYEPNLYKIADSEIALSFNGESFIDRNHPNCFNEFCETIDIKSCTGLRKLFSKNPKTILVFKYLCILGMEDKNIIYRFLESEELVDLVLKRPDCFMRFSRYVLMEKNEKKLLTVFSKKRYYADDTLNMLDLCWDFVSEETKKNILDEGFNRYNHDVVSKTFNERKQKNVKFEYRRSQKRLQMIIDGFAFHLPYDSNALKEIGERMHNCVSSYARMVELKSGTIVFAEKNGELKICIEIRNNKVCQALGPQNTKLSGESEVALRKWCLKNNLEY